MNWVETIRYRRTTSGVPFGRYIEAAPLFEAMRVGVFLGWTSKPPKTMPAKNTATMANIMTPSFRGAGTTVRSCLSRSSWSR